MVCLVGQPFLAAAGLRPGVSRVRGNAGSKAGGGLKARPTKLRQFVAHGEDSPKL
jgi:hypothetical protein